MEPIDDLDALRLVLKPLAERGLIVYLGQEGRRGSQLTHGFHTPRELEHLKISARSAEAASEVAAPPLQRSATPDTGLAEARQEITALRSELTGLRETVRIMQEQLTRLMESLGA